jgi:hypothetical protein
LEENMATDVMRREFRGNEFADLAAVTDDRPQDSSGQHAIDAWESEGGGSTAGFGGFDAARTALEDIAGWRANNNTGWEANHSDEEALKNADGEALTRSDEEDRILRCLGAAVITRWNTLPTKVQRELFDNASAVGELLEAGALKGQIARFVHKHKDDAA